VPLVASITTLLMLDRRLPPRLVALAGAVAVGAVLYWRPVWPLYWPPVLFDFVVAYAFGRTLAAGRTPLIEQFMQLAYSDIPPLLVRHARRITWVWTLVMAALGCATACLIASGHADAWFALANVVGYLLFAGIFVLEYAYRRLCFPPQYHISPFGIARLVCRHPLWRRDGSELAR